MTAASRPPRAWRESPTAYEVSDSSDVEESNEQEE